MSVKTTLILRIRGDSHLISQARDAILPDFGDVLADEKVTRFDSESEWEVKIKAKSMARLRALTNSLMRAISLVLQTHLITAKRHRSI